MRLVLVRGGRTGRDEEGRGVVIEGPPARAEAEASIGWLERAGPTLGAQWRTLEDELQVESLGAALADADLAWCHAVPAECLPDSANERLATWVTGGGRLLCSLDAAGWGTSLGSSHRPLAVARSRWRDAADPYWPESFRAWPDYPHVRGFQGWGAPAHSLFEGFQGGAFTWMAQEAEAVHRVTLAPAEAAERGVRAIAVERAYVQLLCDEIVAWERAVGAGLVVCLGANVALARDHALASQRDHLLINALRYLAHPPPPDERHYWPVHRTHARVSVIPAPVPLLADAPILAAPVASSRDRGICTWTLAGARSLAVGDPTGQLVEIWIDAICAVQGCTFDVEPNVEEVRVTPGDVTRTFTDGAGVAWVERLVVEPDAPGVHHTITPRTPQSPDGGLEITLHLPVRLSWPLPPNALRPLRAELRTSRAAGTAVITCRDGHHLVVIRVDGARAIALRGDDTAPQLQLLSAGDEPLRIHYAATVVGGPGHSRPSPSAMGDAARAQQRRIADVMQKAPRLATPDEAAGAAFDWAVHRLAAFRAMTPDGRGEGLTAGFAASRPGWGASRPGYAWFFGRDTCWCVDALLASGQFALARASIDVLVRTQNITGKVIHEWTRSGVAHYDAADSTPLFLRAVAAYAEWTGDLDSVERWWDAVERALRFVRSTDRDGDGLPENTGIGHGWVEDGPLGGGAVTSYVAAIWIDALRRLHPVAERVKRDTADQVHDALVRAERGLDRLRGSPIGRLALHRASNGVLVEDLTALATVPIALGVEEPGAARATMSALVAERFRASWGLRMLPTDDPRYAPRAYHAGSVWPLFTGWAARAAFAVGRPDDGWSFVAANARACGVGALGAFPEVLDGDTGALAGVCPDQAWSAAMMVAPVVSGLFGVRPLAYANRCQVVPQLPERWSEMFLGGDAPTDWSPGPGPDPSCAHRAGATSPSAGLRVGGSRLEIRVVRDETSAPRVAARWATGPALELEIHPLPPGSAHGER
jgi:glycogen debranching enzyme